MNKFHKTVASILAVLMLLASANFAVLAAEEIQTAQPEETVVLSASGDASASTAGILDGINIDWENYVTESTGTQLTRDYTLGLSSDYLYDTLPSDTQERFEHVRNSLPDEIPVFAPYTNAEIDASKVKFYVSPDGNDLNPGTIDEPFKTPERALKAVNNLKSKKGGVTVYFRKGVYSLNDTMSFTQKSGGSSEKDLVFYTNYGDEEVIFTAAMSVLGSQLQKANDETFNKKVSDSVKPHVYSVDLSKLGYTDFGVWTREARPSLFVDGVEYTIARWPNIGMTNMAYYEGADGQNGIVDGVDRIAGMEFQVANPRPFTWENTDNIWLYGYFHAEWSKAHYRIKSWNEQKKTIKSYDASGYVPSYQKEKSFYYYNILEELDMPGEWFLDNKTGMLYIYPSVEIEDDTLVQIVTGTKSIFYLYGTQYTVFDGLTFDMGYDCIRIWGGAYRNIIQRCNFKNASSFAINQDETTYENGVICSIIQSNITLSGLTSEQANRPAGNFIQNCYTKRINLRNGTRDIISHNLMTGFDSSGFAVYGDGSGDRIFEYNEMVAGPDIQLDAGLFYNNGMSRNVGNIVRYNYFNRSTITPRSNPFGIYLDDISTGMYVYGNLLNEASIFIHGGSNNMIYNNMVCKTAGKNSMFNSDAYINSTGNWGSFVMGDSYRYMMGYPIYYTTSWQSKYPYHYDWHRRMVQALYYFTNTPNYSPELDTEGIYLSGQRENVYKNNVFVDASYDLTVAKSEIDMVEENNLVFEDPSALNFTDWENGVYDADPETFAELCPGIEPFKKNVQMGPIFDPALLTAPIELAEIKPSSPVDTEEIKILPSDITLKWNEVFGKSSYNVKVATDPEFENVIFETELQEESVSLPALEFGQQYYWTVSTNSWTEKVSKTPSVMKTATFITYTFEEAIDIIELDTYDIDAAIKTMTEIVEGGSIVEEGTPEAENYPSDMPLYKAGTKEKLYKMIEEAKRKKEEIKIQDELDAYTLQCQKDFYIALGEYVNPYVINIGQGSYQVVPEKYNNNAPGAIQTEHLGDTLKVSTVSGSGMVAYLDPAVRAGATLAMSIRHEKLANYTGVDILAAVPVSTGITAITGYCVIFKSDLIELQRYPKPASGAILVEVVNNEEIVRGGQWFDFTSEVKPTKDGVRVIVKINGETIIDYLDEDAPLDCYAPGYFGFMHHWQNTTTEYSSIRNVEVTDDNFVSTVVLEKAIKDAEANESNIIESDSASGIPTYKTGTKAKLKAAINVAKAALETVESKEDVTKAAEVLNAVVADVKKNDANECVYAVTELNLIQWEASSALSMVKIAENDTIIAVTPDENESTMYTFKKALTSKQKMRFGVMYNKVGDWHAIATRQVDANVTPTSTRSYFFVIKDDLIEFQKYTEGGKGEILAKVPNNGQIIPGRIYDVEVGSVNVDGGVLSTLKVNGNLVLEYLDTKDPIYDEGYFAFYCDKTLGRVAISPISEGNL